MITVGVVNDLGTPERSDDTVTSYSSRGPTRAFDAATGRHDNLLMPDIVAPGNRVIAPEAPDNWIVTNYPDFGLEDTRTDRKYMYLNGTSMAAPVVTGIVAQMLEMNNRLTPSMVKGILMWTAQTLPDPDVFEQGAGLVNAEGAMRIAFEAFGGEGQPGDEAVPPEWMPHPYSTLNGETFPWAEGRILLRRDPDGDGVTELVEGGGILFTEGVLFSEGIVFAEGVLFSEGVLFGEGVLFSESHLGMVGNDGVLANGDDDGMLPQGVLFGEGVLFSESELAVHFSRANNVLVAGEAFTYGDTGPSGGSSAPSGSEDPMSRTSSAL